MILREFTEDQFITSKDVLKARKNILGYIANEDRMSGALKWYNPKNKEEDYIDTPILYATPSWDDEWGIIPFEGPDADSFGKLDFTKTKYVGNKPLQLKLYFEAVKIAIQKLERKYRKK